MIKKNRAIKTMCRAECLQDVARAIHALDLIGFHVFATWVESNHPRFGIQDVKFRLKALQDITHPKYNFDLDLDFVRAVMLAVHPNLHLMSETLNSWTDYQHKTNGEVWWYGEGRAEFKTVLKVAKDLVNPHRAEIERRIDCSFNQHIPWG